MQAPDPPANENERLRALLDLDVLDTEPEEDFDALTQLASHICGTPIALVSLVDGQRQWFKSRVGLAATETPREVSFCGHVVESGELLVVPDANADERFLDNPLVTGDPNVRFYAGAPLTDRLGHTLGTLCVIDHAPRQLSAEQRHQLVLLSKQVQRLLDLRGTVGRLQESMRVREDLERQNALFFELNLDLLCIAGFDGFFKKLNPSFPRTLGWSEAQLLGAPFVEFVHPEDRDATNAEAAKLAQGHRTVHFENRYRCRNGEYRWLSWTAAASLEDETIYAAARDVTEIKRIESMKDEFVSVVSHELRTPLTSIRGSLGLIQGGVVGSVEPGVQNLVDIAVNNTDRLVRLINDMLDLEKIEAGKLELVWTTLDPARMVAAAVEATDGLARQSDVSVVADIQQTAEISGDLDRLVQVLTNLLSNAIKFSPKGAEVRIRANLRGVRLRVEVVDCGPGIPEKDLDRVFDRFEQVDSTDSRKVGGTGLGLSICRSLVEQHGGRIGVTSEVGEGSTFWFELPTVELSAWPSPSDGTARHTVLLVEDDRDVAHILRLVLAAAGYRVNVAHTCAEAEALVNLEAPDALVLDLRLPDGTGLELARRLLDDGYDLPIVLVTGHDVDRAEYDEPVLVDWLNKPVDQERLFLALRRATRDPGPAKVLVAEDDEGTALVLSKQLEAIGASVQIARSGREAVDKALADPPDLIILDVGLPEVDGFGVVDALKQGKARTTPLIVYTGRDLDRTERASLQLGLTRHLTKARSTEAEFLNSVTELLNGLLIS